MAESNLFQLKNGQYFLDPEQSKVFGIVIAEQPINSYKWDEMAMAELFAKCYAHNTVYCPETKQWFSYNGSVWIRDSGAILASERLKEFTRLMQIYCGEIGSDDDEWAKKYKAFVAKLGDRRVRDRILKDAQGEATIRIERFDADPYLINCENGTYNLLDGKFHFHTPEDYLTMKTTCNFPLPTAALYFDRWEEFIKEITCGDKAIAEYLQIALGYSLVGMANEECMFMAYGKTTRNGKGTLLNTIYNILGDYAKSVSVDVICRGKYKKSSEDANPLLCSLKGVRFVVMSEPKEGSYLDEETMKGYTGCDPITTRQLYGESFSFIPQFKMWLSCNTLPNVHDRSVFSSDRVKIIEFNKHFSETERDTELKAKFLNPEAKSVIFKWLLDGYTKYRKQGLKEPNSVKTAIKTYELQNDMVGLFIEDMCEREETALIGRTDLYNSYKNWCRTNGINHPKSAQKFYDEVERHAASKIRNGYRYFQGLKLRNISNVKM